MTTLSLDKIAETAAMARLGLSKEAQKSIQHDINKMLALLEKLNAINVEGIARMDHPLDLPAYARQDEVTETNQRAHFQSIAPEVKNGYYLVPKVIDESGIGTSPFARSDATQEADDKLNNLSDE